MSIYMSRAELEEISEGLITAYANKFSNRVIQSIDIEHFITEFLMLRIEYASFAEDDAGRIGFLVDGATPLLVHQDGKIIPFVFPKDTIVLDKFLLAEKEQGRRRFTMAHEASHHILSKMYAMPSEGRFHAEYDSERSYSKEELAQMFASVEWQADTMGASLLMPRRIIENALAKYNQSNPIKVYGDNTITSKDKTVIRRMAAYIGVSYTALVIRLRDIGKVTGLRWCDIDLEEGIIDVNHTLVYYDHRTSEGKKGCYFNVNTPKTEAGNRQVPMLDFVREAFVMEKQRQELPGVHCEATVDGYTDFIFLNRFGQPQHQSTLNKAIRRIIRDCNDEQFLKTENPEVLLPHFSCHSLRHTFTTRMCEAGVNIKVIQDTLGHKDITTTLNIYTDVTKELKKTEFEGLDKYFDNSIA